MKYFALLALPLSLTPALALATPINGQFSMTGMSVYDNGSSLVFGSNVVHVGDASTLYGSFQELLTADEAGVISSPVEYQNYVPESASIIFSSSSSTLTFMLDSINIVNIGNFRNFVGTGTVTTKALGYDQQSANLLFTTQGDGSVTFSATVLAPASTPPTTAPEPSSLACLGTGLLGLSRIVKTRSTRKRLL